jgi:hypothetical protein
VREVEERADVLVAREVEDARLDLVVIPEGVDLDAVEARALDAQQAVAPQGARDAGVLNAGRREEGALAVDEEAAFIEVDRAFGRRERGVEILRAEVYRAKSEDQHRPETVRRRKAHEASHLTLPQHLFQAQPALNGCQGL